MKLSRIKTVVGLKYRVSTGVHNHVMMQILCAIEKSVDYQVRWHIVNDIRQR